MISTTLLCRTFSYTPMIKFLGPRSMIPPQPIHTPHHHNHHQHQTQGKKNFSHTYSTQYSGTPSIFLQSVPYPRLTE
jgi:hypothetical protein